MWWSRASEAAQGLRRQLTDEVLRQALHRQTDCRGLGGAQAAFGKEDLKRENSAADHRSTTRNGAGAGCILLLLVSVYGLMHISSMGSVQSLET